MNRNNLVEEQDKKGFYVWIDPAHFLARYHITTLGLFSSQESKSDNLMFVPNSDFNQFISPFQYNLLNNYLAEYNLELARRSYFSQYPSRLDAIFLFETKEEAINYGRKHREHVFSRILKKVVSDGLYKFSKHDLSWIDFLNLGLSNDSDTLDNVSRSYWSGERVCDCKLLARGVSWTQKPILEILYIGTIKFENRNLDKHDVEVDIFKNNSEL